MALLIYSGHGPNLESSASNSQASTAALLARGSYACMYLIGAMTSLVESAALVSELLGYGNRLAELIASAESVDIDKQRGDFLNRNSRSEGGAMEIDGGAFAASGCSWSGSHKPPNYVHRYRNRWLSLSVCSCWLNWVKSAWSSRSCVGYDRVDADSDVDGADIARGLSAPSSIEAPLVREDAQSMLANRTTSNVHIRAAYSVQELNISENRSECGNCSYLLHMFC